MRLRVDLKTLAAIFYERGAVVRIGAWVNCQRALRCRELCPLASSDPPLRGRCPRIVHEGFGETGE